MADEEDKAKAKDKKGGSSGSSGRAMNPGAKRTDKEINGKELIDQIDGLLKEFATASVSERRIILAKINALVALAQASGIAIPGDIMKDITDARREQVSIEASVGSMRGGDVFSETEEFQREQMESAKTRAELRVLLKDFKDFWSVERKERISELHAKTKRGDKLSTDELDEVLKGGAIIRGINKLKRKLKKRCTKLDEEIVELKKKQSDLTKAKEELRSKRPTAGKEGEQASAKAPEASFVRKEDVFVATKAPEAFVPKVPTSEETPVPKASIPKVDVPLTEAEIDRAIAKTKEGIKVREEELMKNRAARYEADQEIGRRKKELEKSADILVANKGHVGREKEVEEQLADHKELVEKPEADVIIDVSKLKRFGKKAPPKEEIIGPAADLGTLGNMSPPPTPRAREAGSSRKV